MVLYQLATLALALAFGYVLLTKLRSRHTIALHRRPEDIRRKPWEPADYSFMGIPITVDSNIPKGQVWLQNSNGQKRIISNIDWSDVF